ncbi:uncharacterized protein LOC144754265 isoform X1 [Lissotriton helveticus]
MFVAGCLHLAFGLLPHPGACCSSVSLRQGGLPCCPYLFSLHSLAHPEQQFVLLVHLSALVRIAMPLVTSLLFSVSPSRMLMHLLHSREVAVARRLMALFCCCARWFSLRLDANYLSSLVHRSCTDCDISCIPAAISLLTSTASLMPFPMSSILLFRVLHLALDRHDGLSLHPLDLHHAPLQATEHTGTLHTCSYTAFSEPAASGNITGHLCTGLQCASATFTRQECIVCDWRTDEPGATSVFSFGLLPTGEKLP